MAKTVEKWMVIRRIYEFGEVVSESEETYGGQDIVFDTEKEALEYINDSNVDCEFSSGYASLTTISEDTGINYKEVKKQKAKEAEVRRLYLKPCPFCGQNPERVGTNAKCAGCSIVLPDAQWNVRKCTW